MRQNNARKDAARRLAKEQGISYVHALRILDEQNDSAAQQPTMHDVLLGAVANSLQFVEVADPGQARSGGLLFNGVPMPKDVERITVDYVDPSPGMLDWSVDETYDETTMAITITAEAEVGFEGFIHRADWHALDESEQDELSGYDWMEGPVEEDHGNHYVEVSFTRPARLTYTATVEDADLDVQNLECISAEAI
jgi:hypothetical protein